MSSNVNYGGPSRSSTKITDSYEYKRALKKKKRWDLLLLISLSTLIICIPLTSVLWSEYAARPNYLPYTVPGGAITTTMFSVFGGICLFCAACGRGKHKRTVKSINFQHEQMTSAQKQQKIQQMHYEQKALRDAGEQLKRINAMSGKAKVDALQDLIRQVNGINAQIYPDQKQKSIKQLQSIFREEYSSFVEQKKRNAMKKLKNLFKISKRINLNDITKTLDIQRDQFMNMLLDNPEIMGNFHLEGDYLTLEDDTSVEEGLDSFMSGLDAQFDDWENKEVTKDGKIEDFDF